MIKELDETLKGIFGRSVLSFNLSFLLLTPYCLLPTPSPSALTSTYRGHEANQLITPTN